MQKNNPKLNGEGYFDPTAYYGTLSIVKAEKELDDKVHTMVHLLRDVAHIAGFEIVGRITFRHIKTGKEFK
jgi:hypothetical protein